MQPRISRILLTSTLALAMLAVSSSVATAAEAFIANSGTGFVLTDTPGLLNEFPRLESVSPVPSIIDPLEQELIPVLCQIGVRKRNQPVKNARGTYRAQLVVLDRKAGTFKAMKLASGAFKTGENGFASFDFEIPATIFADGFESGDVSAWSYTRTKFLKKRKKKGDRAQVDCSIGADKPGA